MCFINNKSFLRLGMSGSWHALHGVEADLTCYSKAIANGHPLSVLLGSKKCRTEGAEKVGREKSPKQEIELKNVLRFLIFHSCRFTISLKKQSKALHNLFFSSIPANPLQVFYYRSKYIPYSGLILFTRSFHEAWLNDVLATSIFPPYHIIPAIPGIFHW